MTNETTIEKLREMRLSAFAASLKEQMSDSSFQSLSFEERLGLLVDVEWSSRKNNRLKRLIKAPTLIRAMPVLQESITGLRGS